MSAHINEEWVEFDALPNYAVSNHGRVLNTHRNRELKASKDSNGYSRVAMYHQGRRYDAYIHRLVAKAFLPNYEEGVEIKHIDENKDDNSAANLEIGEKHCRVSERLW